MDEVIVFLRDTALDVQRGCGIKTVLTSEPFTVICKNLARSQWFIMGPSYQDEYAIIFLTGSNLYFFDVDTSCLVDFEINDSACGRPTGDIETDTVVEHLSTANIEDFTIMTSGGFDESRLRVILGRCQIKILTPTQEDIRTEHMVMAFSGDYIFMIDKEWKLHFLDVVKNM